jgi:ribonucleoside-diphosphate reductase subunit M1
MFIVKRDGRKEPVYYDKITARNMKLAADLSVDTVSLSQTVIRGLNTGMSTRDIDQLSCESAIHRSIYEPDYGILSSRIAWNDLHKNTPKTFRENIELLYRNFNTIKNKNNPLISTEVYNFAINHIDEIERTIDYENDYKYSYFAFRTLEKSYLQRVNKKIVERNQSMLMRVALGIHGPSIRNGIKHEGNIEKTIKTYKLMSDMKFTHASPTLFNAGTNRPQNSSCFLLESADSMGEDPYDEQQNFIDIEEESIQKCWDQCTKISKNAGGIGITLTKVRCRGSYIAGSNGRSSGIIPLCKVFNDIAKYVDQAGKRKGAFALYLEPWHPDTPEFLELKTQSGDENTKARDIQIGLWNNNLFFERLEKDEMWSFFCPSSYPELIQLYGEEFNNRYIELERQEKYCRQMKAAELWKKVIISLEQTGNPYMLNKDECNIKSNHKNIGTITSSNLCTEIVQYHTPKSIGVCNLASISLPSFVDKTLRTINFEEIAETTMVITENLNLIIDKNYYPLKETITNNLSLRPTGTGVQGLADVFAMFHIVWGDEESMILNQVFFEVIYFYSLKQSALLAREYGSYDRFEGSPYSQGILQFDMWNVKPITRHDNDVEYNYTWKVPKLNWDELKTDYVMKGMRNSLLLAPMPTAGTSQILGNNEAFEPFTSNIYARKVMAGDFPLVNQHLYLDLKDIGKWNKENVDIIIKNNGSVQELDIPQKLKDVYRTVWEIPQKIIIDMAADRGAFIDQSQSMNIHIARPTTSKLSSMYMYAIKKKLKTLSYYVRSLATVDAVKFTIMEISDPTQKIREEILKSGEDKGSGGEYKCDDNVCIPCGS